jgi:hypothetical protein
MTKSSSALMTARDRLAQTASSSRNWLRAISRGLHLNQARSHGSPGPCACLLSDLTGTIPMHGPAKGDRRRTGKPSRSPLAHRKVPVRGCLWVFHWPVAAGVTLKAVTLPCNVIVRTWRINSLYATTRSRIAAHDVNSFMYHQALLSGWHLRRGRNCERQPYIPPIGSAIAIKLIITLQIQVSLLVADREQISDLRSNSDDTRFV